MDKLSELVGIFTVQNGDDVIELRKHAGMHNETYMVKELDKMIGFPFTAVIERSYVDKVYRNTYYSYFSSKHFDIPRDCNRVSFFRGCLSVDDFLGSEEELQKAFIGISIVKPIKNGCIGRTLLDPKKLNIADCYVRTTRFDFMILGKNLKVDAFPFSSQDSETMTCAETTVWNILEYCGQRYPEYKTILPSDIKKELDESAQERIWPSEGLNYYQVSKLLKKFGFEPKVYSLDAHAYREKDFRRFFHYYVESGIPIAVGLINERDKIGHSVVCIGHGAKCTIRKEKISTIIGSDIKYLETCDFFDDYVIVDDNQIPYTVKEYDNLTLHNGMKVHTFAVPLYKHILLEAVNARNVVNGVLEITKKVLTSVLDKEDNPLILRFFLTSSRKFKHYRCNSSNKNEMKLYSLIPYPKFLWIGEISTISKYKEEKVIGEIVIDATSSKNSKFESVISIRYKNCFGYRLKDEDFEKLANRLKNPMNGLGYDYSLYKNNLELIKKEEGK